MPFTALLFVHRLPHISPAAFKSHYESQHIHIVQSIAGALFPNSHTRRYIQRSEPKAEDTSSNDDSANTECPATVLVGTQADFDYDAIAELVFKDGQAFQKFFKCISEPEAAKKIAEDEKHFLDSAKMTAVVVGDCTVTNRLK